MAAASERERAEYRNARFILLAVATLGDLSFGGLIFGWNALTQMLKEQGNYTNGCDLPQNLTAEGTCRPQQNRLTLIYTLGLFAVNFGPVPVGPVLDAWGPRFISVVGCGVSVLGLVLFGVSHSGGFDHFVAASLLFSLGGITWHLGQFHIGSLFPRARGVVSGCAVGGFVGSGIIFLMLKAILTSLGGSRAAFRGVFIVYAAYCSLWLPLSLWVMPAKALQLGQVYVFTRSWRFRTLTLDAYSSSLPSKGLTEDSSQPKGETAKRNGDVQPLCAMKGGQTADTLTQRAVADPGSAETLSNSVHSSAAALQTADDGGDDAAAASDRSLVANNYACSSSESAMRERQEHLRNSTVTAAVGTDHVVIPVSEPAISSRSAAACPTHQIKANSEGMMLSRRQLPGHTGGKPPVADSEAVVAAAIQPSEGFQTFAAVQDVHASVVAGSITGGLGLSPAGTGTTGPWSGAVGAGSTSAETRPGPGSVDPESAPGSARAGSGSGSVDRQEKAVVLREPARFAALKQKSLWRQLVSAEAIYLTLFFTANVLILQLYLGLSTQELKAKGDNHSVYADLVVVILALGALWLPLMHYLSEFHGYAVTLTAINTLGLLSSVLQAVPNLPLQIVTVICWCGCRVLLYSSFYAMVNALFGVTNFGRIVGITNSFTGLVGLLVLPLSDVAIGAMRSKFWKLNLAQALALLPLYGFCYAFWRWSRQDLVDLRFTGREKEVPGQGPPTVPVGEPALQEGGSHGFAHINGDS